MVHIMQLVIDCIYADKIKIYSYMDHFKNQTQQVVKIRDNTSQKYQAQDKSMT